jgi:hypothetical protein
MCDIRYIIFIHLTSIIDICIISRYILNFSKLKHELTIKRSTTFVQSKLIYYLILELIFCTIFVPPYYDVHYSGVSYKGTYTFSLNDISKKYWLNRYSLHFNVIKDLHNIKSLLSLF